MTGEPGRSVYYPNLDGLRGVAVLMVVYGHAGYQGWVPLVVGWASTGVILFFFLSGFLMGSHYLPDAPDGIFSRPLLRYWLSFLLRRFVRVYPPYFFAPLVGYLLLMPSLPPAFKTDVALSDPSLVGQLARVLALDGNLGIYWTIKVELFFYLLYPFLIALFLACRRKASVLAALFVALAFLNHFRHGVGGISWYVPVFSDWGGYIAIFVGGVLTAIVAHRIRDGSGPARLPWSALALASLVAFLAATLILAQSKPTQMASWQKEWLFVPVLFVLFTSLLCADGLVSRILASRPGVILGRMSYSLYLVHIIGFMIAKRWLPEELPGAIAAILVLVVLTPVFFVLFERPFVRLSKRIVVEVVRRREPAPQPA